MEYMSYLQNNYLGSQFHILRDISEHPFSGIAKPEPLKKTTFRENGPDGLIKPTELSIPLTAIS